MIELRSDNAAGVAPEILAAIEAANVGSALAYGEDDLTAGLHDVVREVFEHPTARVFPVTSGTAANALSLSSLTPPWGAVLCHPTAHIITAEGGSTSLLGAGAVMQGVDGEHALIDPDRLRARLDATRWGDPHESQPSVLSLTVPSDDGTLYQPDADRRARRDRPGQWPEGPRRRGTPRQRRGGSWAAHPPTSPGGRGSTCCPSVPSRTALSGPRRSSPSTTRPPISSCTERSAPAT